MARGFGLDWIVSTQSIPYSDSDYHLYQVLGGTGIGLGDHGNPRML